jgi:hypothetical protein
MYPTCNRRWSSFVWDNGATWARMAGWDGWAASHRWAGGRAAAAVEDDEAGQVVALHTG